jgi:farnesyl-diphosphate farnesyltransferase
VSGLSADQRELLTTLLKQVSRSFYLTLRILPKKIRPQIGLAYLLARTTDTIADTEIVSLDRRLESLRALRERISGASAAPLNFGELTRQQSSPAERELLEKTEASLALLKNFSAADQKLIRTVLETITSGQELDLKRFSSVAQGAADMLSAESPGISTISSADLKSAALFQKPVSALKTNSELDDYTYRVAGCVGEFWTEMCLAHLFRMPELQDLMWSDEFKKLGVRFGKGLQLVNILRDIPADLQKGRCYLPAEELAKLCLVPTDLLRIESEPKLRPLYNRYLDLAESHLKAGWEYTNRIPFRWINLRLACAWPILIGVKTIQRLRSGNILDSAQRTKISRAEVRNLILKSIVLYPFPNAWRAQVAHKI